MELLIVDDSPTDRMVMKSRMQRAFPALQILLAGEAAEFSDVLKRENCDVVITDYWLGWGDGLSVLQRVRKRWARCKVIFLTGNGGEEVVAEAFKYGLFYYLLKPDGFENLVTVTRTALETKQREDHYIMLASMLGAVPDAVFSFDAQGALTTWNRGAEQLFGYSAAEIVGKQLETLVATSGRAEARRALGRALKGEVIVPHELACARRDGSRINTSISFAPVRIDERQISTTACIARELPGLHRSQNGLGTRARAAQAAERSH
ncbi:MAG TPA: response regulator [Candidatus Binataceae bacterium]|nr:response regulator [Candidatus Binataceae bacterium]